MTAAYNPAEVERLVGETRAEIQRRRTATRCDSCGGLILHRSERWLADLADQLEAARAEILALKDKAGLLQAMREAFDRAAAENNQGGDPTELARRVMDEVQSQPYAVVHALAKQVIRDHRHTLSLMVDLEAALARIAELEARPVGQPPAPLAPGDSVVLEVDGRSAVTSGYAFRLALRLAMAILRT